MVTVRTRRLLSLLVSAATALSLVIPAVAWAAETEAVVSVENHTSADATISLSDITIDQVDVPKAGMQLDDTATVQAAGGEQWDIPVLWVSESLQICTQASEGESYLPVLAFFVPQEYLVQGSGFTVTLSSSLTKLFGGREIISVYDSSTGIAYILPASLRDLFAAQRGNVASEESAVETEEASNVAVAPANVPADDRQSDQEDGQPQEPEPEIGRQSGLIDIYCSQTARDAFSDEDLEYLLDLVINKLQPQAVELLLEKFPAFRAAADMGQIGREIGMYVYYEKGDKDGVPEHEDSPTQALAFVAKDAIQEGDDVKFCYFLGIELSSLVKKDYLDNPIRDEQTGKLVLMRAGANMRTFENTMVHELFHAFMDDYNRTGMLGATNLRDALTDREGNWPSEELAELYDQTAYPKWFVEGTASAVENVFQYRYSYFDTLRTGTFDGVSADDYSAEMILKSYLNAKDSDGEDLCFDLAYAAGITKASGTTYPVAASRYVSGYLATVYLSELAARKTTGSSVIQDEKGITVSSERIRLGLNSILERMHNGETLDQVIGDISPVDEGGTKRYADTKEFETEFIKGPVTEGESGSTCEGDYGAGASLEFMTTFLQYLNDLDTNTKSGDGVNGSILFDFQTDFESPLDGSKEATSDYFNIVESNRYVESTVPNEVALAGGGMSRSGTSAAVAAASDSVVEAPEDEMAAAADVACEEAVPEEPEAEPEPEPESEVLPDAA